MEADAAYQGYLKSCKLCSRLLAVGCTGACDLEIAHTCYAIPRLRTCVTQSRDCAHMLCNLGIQRMRNTISRLRRFSDCAEHVYTILHIARTYHSPGRTCTHIYIIFYVGHTCIYHSHCNLWNALIIRIDIWIIQFTVIHGTGCFEFEQAFQSMKSTGSVTCCTTSQAACSQRQQRLQIVSELSLPTTRYTSCKISSVLLTRARSTTMKHAGHCILENHCWIYNLTCAV